MDVVVIPDTTNGGARLVLYREADGTVPVIDWLDDLPRRARAKVFVRLEALAFRWHALRPDESAPLRDGLHELRVRHSGAGYYIYFFRFGLGSIVLAGAVTAKARDRRGPAVESALNRKRCFEADPRAHTFAPEPQS